ncbi:uncharacterized [Tachysurus ichikawai]
MTETDSLIYGSTVSGCNAGCRELGGVVAESAEGVSGSPLPTCQICMFVWLHASRLKALVINSAGGIKAASASVPPPSPPPPPPLSSSLLALQTGQLPARLRDPPRQVMKEKRKSRRLRPQSYRQTPTAGASGGCISCSS